MLQPPRFKDSTGAHILPPPPPSPFCCDLTLGLGVLGEGAGLWEPSCEDTLRAGMPAGQDATGGGDL